MLRPPCRVPTAGRDDVRTPPLRGRDCPTCAEAAHQARSDHRHPCALWAWFKAWSRSAIKSAASSMRSADQSIDHAGLLGLLGCWHASWWRVSDQTFDAPEGLGECEHLGGSDNLFGRFEVVVGQGERDHAPKSCICRRPHRDQGGLQIQASALWPRRDGPEGVWPRRPILAVALHAQVKGVFSPSTREAVIGPGTEHKNFEGSAVLLPASSDNVKHPSPRPVAPKVFVTLCITMSAPRSGFCSMGEARCSPRRLVCPNSLCHRSDVGDLHHGVGQVSIQTKRVCSFNAPRSVEVAQIHE